MQGKRKSWKIFGDPKPQVCKFLNVALVLTEEWSKM